jgi:curved DNA-binding protein CbpA
MAASYPFTMDPYAVLGVAPGSSPEEVARAYRAKAKEWHPDIRGTEDALRRMAVINAAYEQIRDGRKPAAPRAAARTEHGRAGRVRRRAGHWLPDDVRRSLGAELLAALEDREPVELVTRASTWASPQTLLAVTDSRLLWLLDDAISHRVRSLEFKAITGVEKRDRRKSSAVRISRRRGRPVEFAELPAEIATTLAASLPTYHT